MKRTTYDEMDWLKLDWQRPFKLEAVTDLLVHLAAHTPQTHIIFESRGYQGRISYFIGMDRKYTRIITDAMRAHGNIRFSRAQPSERILVNVASQLSISKPVLSLKTDITDAAVRAGIAAHLQSRGDEQSVLQVILGQPHSISPMPANLPDPHASWFKVAFGTVEEATAESKTVIKEKMSCPSFNAVIRLGATGTPDTARGHILSMLSALRVLRSAGVNIQLKKEDPNRINFANIPWKFPLRLSVKEIVNFLLLPIGENELPGVTSLHPKQVMPPSWYRNPIKTQDRTFAVSLDGRHKLSVSPKDSLEHTVILGPTGSGKSTAMQRQIMADVEAGRSVLLLDPKSDTADAIIARIPEHLIKNLVVIDPSSPCPVGLNPLAYKNHHNPGLIADSILAVFQQLFSENWGIRSQDVISAALLTLVKTEGSSLLWLPTLLTDDAFRQKVTSKIDDKIGIGAFWTAFEEMKPSERRQEILPTLNKVRQFLLRPGLRNVLGQANPKFDLNDLFTKQRIVLVPLNKGLIGGESAKLLGSLIVGLTWTLALGRAGMPEEKRTPVSIYIDELQDYVSSISADFSDALAQARGLGVSITMAHQYREQLPPEIRAGIDANARNKIIFGISASDAKDMAAMAPDLSYEDFMALPRYQVYASFNDNGRNVGWVSGKTLPMTRPIRNVDEIKKKVAQRYGKPGSEVEQEYLDLLASCRNDEVEVDADSVGRRKVEVDASAVGRRKKDEQK